MLGGHYGGVGPGRRGGLDRAPTGGRLRQGVVALSRALLRGVERSGLGAACRQRRMGRCLAPVRPFTARVRYPSRDSRASSRADSSAGKPPPFGAARTTPARRGFSVGKTHVSVGPCPPLA